MAHWNGLWPSLMLAVLFGAAHGAWAMTIGSADTERLGWPGDPQAVGVPGSGDGALSKFLRGGILTGDGRLDLWTETPRGGSVLIDDGPSTGRPPPAATAVTRGASRLRIQPNFADLPAGKLQWASPVGPQFSMPPGQVISADVTAEGAVRKAWGHGDGGQVNPEPEVAQQLLTLQDLIAPLKQFVDEHFAKILASLGLAGLVYIGAKAYSRRI